MENLRVLTSTFLIFFLLVSIVSASLIENFEDGEIADWIKAKSPYTVGTVDGNKVLEFKYSSTDVNPYINTLGDIEDKKRYVAFGSHFIQDKELLYKDRLKISFEMGLINRSYLSKLGNASIDTWSFVVYVFGSGTNKSTDIYDATFVVRVSYGVSSRTMSVYLQYLNRTGSGYEILFWYSKTYANITDIPIDLYMVFEFNRSAENTTYIGFDISAFDNTSFKKNITLIGYYPYSNYTDMECIVYGDVRFVDANPSDIADIYCLFVDDIGLLTKPKPKETVWSRFVSLWWAYLIVIAVVVGVIIWKWRYGKF